MLPESKLTAHQVKEFRAEWSEGSEKLLLIAKVRYDDQCWNGCNSFAITGGVYSSKYSNSRDGIELSCDGRRRGWIFGGCQHDIITRRIPKLTKYIKWHLFTTDGPLHYIANSLYCAGHCKRWPGPDEWGNINYPANWEHFCSTAIFGALDGEDDKMLLKLQHMSKNKLKGWLEKRLPALVREFKKDVESLGFVY